LQGILTRRSLRPRVGTVWTDADDCRSEFSGGWTVRASVWGKRCVSEQNCGFVKLLSARLNNTPGLNGPNYTLHNMKTRTV